MSYFRYFLSILFVMMLSNVLAQRHFDKGKSMKAGTVSQFLLSVKDGKHEAGLPVKVIKGINEGPVFTIVAGIHGYEYPPIIAMQKLMNEIKPEQLSGTVVIVPVANVAGFYGRSVFYNPEDGKNLNRVFPGREDGSISERLADLITREIITGSDVFLDIHAGDGNEDLADFICYYDHKETPVQTALARKLSDESGFKLKVRYPFNLKADQPSEYAFKQATRQGVAALSIEAGKLGNVQPEAVDMIRNSVMNMLASMHMYKPEKQLKPGKSNWLTEQTYIKSTVKGIFYSDLKSGAMVAEGQSLGYITDLFGKKLTEVTAPVAGLILYKIGTPPVLEEETLFCIGYENR
jgi:predicted deacylase